jgi:hypothetical protein
MRSSTPERDLLEFNLLLRDRYDRIPERKHPSVPLRGFSFLLPTQRYKMGTDELLVKARSKPVLGKRRESAIFTETYYWENQHRYFPDSEESLSDYFRSNQESSSSGGGNTRVYVTAVPTWQGSGNAEFENLITGLVGTASDKGEKSDEACWLITAASCMTAVNEVHHLKLQSDGQTVIRTPPSGWERFVGLPGLHQPVYPSILYRPPPLVLNWIKNGGPKRLHREQNLIPRLNAIISEIIPFGSVAKLMAYLLFHGPDTWGYSPVLPALSFRGIGTRPSVFASYVRADALIRSIAGLHDLIHPGWAPELPENRFGCAHVPDVQEVKDFYASWRMLIQNREDLNDLENIVHRHNGIVAGLHLFGCVLFGGLRNYKGAPPSHADYDASFIINCEKQHFVPT